MLVEEVLAVLNPRPGQICLDCTVGRGGHAEVLIPRLAPGGRYLGLDVDPDNIRYVQERFQDPAVRVDWMVENFSNAPRALASLGISKVDLLLADLGFCSTQMDDPARGFSFRADGPLDMRLDPHLPTTAADLVNRLSEHELADLIYTLGEDRLSRRIARKIVEARARSPINTTAELADVVRRACHRGRPQRRKTFPRGPRSIDPATRTFMALRIAVNDELQALERMLEWMPRVLAGGARAAVICFHSLEDRLVKRAMVGWYHAGLAERLTAKPVVAGIEERRANPRSRSAKLRAVRWKGDQEDNREGDRAEM